MIAIVDKTNPTPSQSSSECYIAYEDFGPRPDCVDCDAIEECPECSQDVAYKVPVVQGDIVYFQFNLEDSFNERPSTPTVGWLEDPSEDYWLSAELQWANNPLSNLELPSNDIILSNSVGYYNGSYQNLIINSAKVYEYMIAEGITDCFRFEITTYRKVVSTTYLTVVSIAVVLPNAANYSEGQYAVTNTGIYQIVNGAWSLQDAPTLGQIVFNSGSGKFYEYTGVFPWIPAEPDYIFEPNTTCYTSWHKFIICEPTLRIYGVHGRTDCNGKYFGEPDFQSSMPYIDTYRIEGTLEMRSITTSEQRNENDIITEFKQFENWILRNSYKSFPDQIARRLANSLTAPTFQIDGNEYVNAGDIAKRNDQGNYWWVEITLQRLLCEKENDCDQVVSSYPFVVPPEFSPCAECPECPPGGEITVSNSDDSYLVVTNVDLELPDTTIEVYVDLVLEATSSIPSISDSTINIHWL